MSEELDHSLQQAIETFLNDRLRSIDEQLARLQAESAAQMPLRPGVAVPEQMVTIDKLKPMAVDYVKLGGRLEELSRGFLKDWVDRNSR